MGINKAFWTDKSVFLTGHTGFKGGWLSLWLQSLGARVSGYALEAPTVPNLFHVARVGEKMQSTIANVLDMELLSAALREAEPEIAFHFAAQPLVRVSYADPLKTYAVNVMGTVHFLEAVRHAPSVHTAIVITSDKCYENRDLQSAFKESAPLGGSDAYSSSKACAEIVTAAYRQSFLTNENIMAATARAGNVIGGGDWAEERLLPDLVRAFTRGETLTLRYPQAIRPWQYVLEPLCGYLMLAERMEEYGAFFAGAWNFGPADEKAWKVEDVVRQAAGLWGNGARWESSKMLHLHEARHLKLDSSRSREKLGWETCFNLCTAIEWTISWYLAHQEKRCDMREFTIAQIDRYQALLESRHRRDPPTSLIQTDAA